MDDLKNKIQGLTPDKAFYIYVGLPLIILVLFLFCTQLSGSMSADMGIINVNANITMSGMQILSQKATATASAMGISQSDSGEVKCGFTFVLGLLFVLSIIGVAVLGFMKKVGNYIFTLVPVVLLFLIAVIGVNDEEQSLKMSGAAFIWIEIVLGLVWAGFAYLRGNGSIDMNQKY